MGALRSRIFEKLVLVQTFITVRLGRQDDRRTVSGASLIAEGELCPSYTLGYIVDSQRTGNSFPLPPTLMKKLRSLVFQGVSHVSGDCARTAPLGSSEKWAKHFPFVRNRGKVAPASEFIYYQ
jgi:hypothetical protein